LARWRNLCSQLLIVHGVSDIRQAEIHTSEPLAPEPSAFEVELAIEKLKKNHTNQQVLINSQQNLLKHWIGQFTLRTIIVLILFGIRKTCVRNGRNRSLYLYVRRVIKQIVVIIGAYHFRQLFTKFYPTSCCPAYLHMPKKLFGIMNVDFSETGQ
jgi:hypothetical protein